MIMRIRLGWRLCVPLVVCAGALAFIAKTVDFDLQPEEPNTVWLKKTIPTVATDFSNLLVPLPNSGGSRVGVKIYDENSWQVYRAYPSGHLDVFFTHEGGRVERLN